MTLEEENAFLREHIKNIVEERNQLAKCVLKINEKRFLSHRFTQSLIEDVKAVRETLISFYGVEVLKHLEPINKPKYRKSQKSKKTPRASKPCIDAAKDALEGFPQPQNFPPDPPTSEP
jgi:hypothetical protein